MANREEKGVALVESALSLFLLTLLFLPLFDVGHWLVNYQILTQTAREAVHIARTMNNVADGGCVDNGTGRWVAPLPHDPHDGEPEPCPLNGRHNEILELTRQVLEGHRASFMRIDNVVLTTNYNSATDSFDIAVSAHYSGLLIWLTVTLNEGSAGPYLPWEDIYGT